MRKHHYAASRPMKEKTLWKFTALSNTWFYDSTGVTVYGPKHVNLWDAVLGGSFGVPEYPKLRAVGSSEYDVYHKASCLVDYTSGTFWATAWNQSDGWFYLASPMEPGMQNSVWLRVSVQSGYLHFWKNVKVEYSIDNGNTWAVQSWNVSVPNTSVDQSLIRLDY